MNAKSGKCPVCDTDSSLEQGGDKYTLFYRVKCPRCGDYYISDQAKDAIITALKLDAVGINTFALGDSASQANRVNALCVEVAKRAKLKGINEARSIISQALRKAENKNTISINDLVNILINNPISSPAEQSNNLIIFLGDHLSSPGDVFKIPEGTEVEKTKDLGGLLGISVGKEWHDLRFIVMSLGEQKILNVDYTGGLTSGGKPIPQSVSLTLAGWAKYEELKRSTKDSKKAFVAMAFPVAAGDREKEEYRGKDWYFQDTLLPRYFIPAAKDAGYDLSNPLLVDPKAGNIHARMEVEIRLSRFLVAEITDGNNGAYWEAGFAKGLGKPVIYTCKREIKPHFDVGSDQTIYWDAASPQDAANQLKAVIRATLFGEAKMTDGP